ncbi:hypothetical protein [Sphingobacterium siyangense]|nr:hypothetical protein [Sphingobacterium siyangense]
MTWQIKFTTDGRTYELRTLESCEIECSVDNLADRAKIILPEAVINRVLQIEGKIKRGSKVVIQLGYDNELVNEFEGYVEKITNDGSLVIHCEDSLFLFRVSVPDVQLKPTSVKKIAEYLIAHIDKSYKLSCDYTINYEKFTIHQATGYDVLKKLQEETKANIYFDSQAKVLHIHPPYIEKAGSVVYSMSRNIEKSSLEYKQAIDKKIEVTVESTDTKGKMKSITVGTTGGDKQTFKVGPMSEQDMRSVAKAALLRGSYDGYEGSFDSWLIPQVAPGYSAKIVDHDYPYKTGWYYVVSVKTNFSASGGVRTITPGIKLSSNG